MPKTPPEIRDVILQRRRKGASLQAISDHLNAYGYDTTQGGTMWRPSSVASVVNGAIKKESNCPCCGQSLAPIHEAQERERAAQAARRAAHRAERQHRR
jgi:hypothetical protein